MISARQIAKKINCLYHAHGRVGASGISSVFDLPSKKSSLQKSSDLYFVNLTLQTREARGIALDQWAELRSARQKIGKMETCLILECLLKHVRTHFTRNAGTLPDHLPSHTGSHST